MKFSPLIKTVRTVRKRPKKVGRKKGQEHLNMTVKSARTPEHDRKKGKKT